MRYPEPLERASLPARFATRGFRLREDRVGSFARSVTAGESDLVVRSFYVPNTDPGRVTAAVDRLRQRVGEQTT